MKTDLHKFREISLKIVAIRMYEGCTVVVQLVWTCCMNFWAPIRPIRPSCCNCTNPCCTALLQQNPLTTYVGHLSFKWPLFLQSKLCFDHSIFSVFIALAKTLISKTLISNWDCVILKLILIQVIPTKSLYKTNLLINLFTFFN